MGGQFSTNGMGDVPHELVSAAIVGQPSAVHSLLSAIAPDVARVCRAVLGRHAPDLDDSVQEALLAFLHALPAYRGQSTLFRYASRIAVRVALSHRRRERRHRARNDALAADPDAPTSVPPPRPDERLAIQVRGEALVRLLAGLPEPQAETLVLRVVLGYTLKETADATGVPLNTVRSRMRLAREALRARILADGDLCELSEVDR